MKERMTQAIEKVIERLTITNKPLPKAPMVCIYLFLILLLSCIVAFLTGWIYSWVVHGDVRFNELNSFISTISSVPFIAAVTFYCSHLIDRNNNGIPDKEEEDHGKDSH